MFWRSRDEGLVSFTGRELGTIEFQRLTAITCQVFVVVFSIEALTSQGSIHAWQLWYIAANIGAFLLSNYLAYRFSSARMYAIAFCELIFAPILLGTTPERPFLSFGLTSLAAMIFLSGWDNPIISVPIMLVLINIQIWVIQGNFTAINDIQDLKLLGTYFSSFWTLGIGIATAYLRVRYLRYNDEIDEVLERYEEDVTRQLVSTNRLNHSDYRNLKLHGTLLNTLIALRLDSSKNMSNAEIADFLERDVESLENPELRNAENLQRAFDELVEIYRGDLAITCSIEVENDLTELEANQILEIARELTLNTKKHTTSTNVHISIKNSAFGFAAIEFTNNALQNLTGDARSEEILQTKSSRSLRRLIDAVNAQLEVSEESNDQIKIVAHLNAHSEPPIEVLKTIRLESITWLSRGLLLSTYIYGIVCLIGYPFIHMSGLLLLANAAQVISITFAYYRPKFSFFIALPAIITTLAIFPLTAIHVTSCSQIRYAPWTYNVLIGSCFYFALSIRNRYLRWIPLGIFFLESLAVGSFYPAGCREILNGSLPGVPIIVVFVFAITNLRKRAIKKDEDRIFSIISNEAEYVEVSNFIDASISQITKYVRNFIVELRSSEMTKEGVEARISELSSDIRLYLSLSEHFSSQFIRGLYEIVNSGNVRINIVGHNLYFEGESMNDLQVIKQAIEMANGERVTIEINAARSPSMVLSSSRFTADDISELTSQCKNENLTITFESSVQSVN